MMRRFDRLTLAMLAVAALCWACRCGAHDVTVPPWRGAASSTLEQWRFGTSSNPAVPDVLNNAYGVPTAAITVGPYGSGWLYWIPGLGTPTGYWDLGSAGTIVCTVPTPPVAAGSYADWVSVQATYFKDITQGPAASVAGATRALVSTSVLENVTTGGQWLVEQTYWRRSPVSNLLTATLLSSAQWGSVIEETVIDTCRVQTVSSVMAAKQLPDGTMFELSGPIVTRSFGSLFYMEDPNRLFGIRVNCIQTQSAPAEGSVPFVVGTISTVDGERVIDQAVCLVQGSQPVPRPWFMLTRAASVLPNPVGLHVKMAGRASVPLPGADEFTLDDGSGQPIRVKLYGVSAPPDGRFVSVCGALGADLNGPVLRTNQNNGIMVY